MKFEELPSLRSTSHEQQYSVSTAVETVHFTILDYDRFITDGFTQFITTELVLCHTRFPTARWNRNVTRSYSRRSDP